MLVVLLLITDLGKFNNANMRQPNQHSSSKAILNAFIPDADIEGDVGVLGEVDWRRAVCSVTVSMLAEQHSPGVVVK